MHSWCMCKMAPFKFWRHTLLLEVCETALGPPIQTPHLRCHPQLQHTQLQKVIPANTRHLILQMERSAAEPEVSILAAGSRALTALQQ
jgi:hypothetical protein